MSDRLTLLETFFKEVVTLTLHHDVIDDNAVVYPNKLELALKKVDPEWWRQHA